MNTTQLLVKNERSGPRYLFSAILMAGALGFAAWGTTALFSDSLSNTADSFTAGTVTVGSGATTTNCSVTELAPGDSSSGYGSGSLDKVQCTFDVEYTGSLPAYLGVDVTLLNGPTALYTGTVGGMQMSIAADGVSVVDGTTFKNQSGVATPVVAGTSVDNILLSTTPVNTGETVTFTVDYLLPLAATNALQGGSANVQLTFHAVQSANQTTSCVAGRQCTSIVWS
jgi:hypothetical protein